MSDPTDYDFGNRPEAEALLEIGNRLDSEKAAVQKQVFALSEAARAALATCDVLESNGFERDANAARAYAADRYDTIAAVYRANGFVGIGESYTRTAADLRKSARRTKR